MTRLLTAIVFNPEHDYALAMGHKLFTPPLPIVHLRQRLREIPFKMASDSDVIIVRDNPSENELLALREKFRCTERNIITVRADSAELRNIAPSIAKVNPWGWDHTIRTQLINWGIHEDALPSPEWIDQLRNLSHRRTTIPFNRMIGQPLPTELFSIDDVRSYIKNMPQCFLKAPWSSSGRGVLDCRKYLSDLYSVDMPDNALDAIVKWATGIIRKQGSVMAETAADKVLDFATEWNISNGIVYYTGLSLFNADPHGHYIDNVRISQEKIRETINEYTTIFTRKTLEEQCNALSTLIAPYYDGPVGIDMMVLRDGSLRSCVEINLRTTMGQI